MASLTFDLLCESCSSPLTSEVRGGQRSHLHVRPCRSCAVKVARDLFQAALNTAVNLPEAKGAPLEDRPRHSRSCGLNPPNDGSSCGPDCPTRMASEMRA